MKRMPKQMEADYHTYCDLAARVNELQKGLKLYKEKVLKGFGRHRKLQLSDGTWVERKLVSREMPEQEARTDRYDMLVLHNEIG